VFTFVLLFVFSLRIIVFLLSFNNCELYIEEASKNFHKQQLTIQVVDVQLSKYNSYLIKFKIQNSKSKNLSFRHKQGILFITREKYEKLIQESQVPSVEGLLLEANGNFKPLPSISNPGGTSKKISYMSGNSLGVFESETNSYFLKSENSIRINSMKFRMLHFWILTKTKIRDSITKQIDTLFYGNGRGLVSAMLLGIKDNISEELSNLLKIHGVSHIIAISGLHIGMLFLLIDNALKLFVHKNGQRFYAVLLLLLLYNLLIGQNVSAIRASFMVIIFSYAMTYGYPYSKTKSVYLSFITYLIFYPYAIFKCGFLLSYGAVCGLFYIYPPLKEFVLYLRYLKSDRSSYHYSILFAVVDLGLISVSVNIATLPILIYFFKGVSATSVIGNILIVPVVMAFYVLSIFSIIISYALPLIGKLIASTVMMISGYMESMTKVLNMLPVTFTYLKVPSFVTIAIYYCLLYIIISKLKGFCFAKEING